MCGFFADYFLTPKISSRMGPLPVLIDIAHNAAAIPGSGNVPVDMTHTADVATFIANILNLKEKWPVEAYVIGEKITLNELVACAEKAKGVKFDVKYDPMEKLQKSETTELPNQKEVYPWYPKPELQRFSAMLGTMMETGQFDLNAGENIVGFKPKTVREMIFEAWGSS
jgi:nucleoside-diphosphate-sugar epimerase